MNKLQVRVYPHMEAHPCQVLTAQKNCVIIVVTDISCITDLPHITIGASLHRLIYNLTPTLVSNEKKKMFFFVCFELLKVSLVACRPRPAADNTPPVIYPFIIAYYLLLCHSFHQLW